MSIASEITRLTTAKSDIKTMANGYLPGTITSETLSTYDDKIEDVIEKYLDNNPSSTSTGTCSNAYDVPCKSFEIDGNSTQASTPTPDSPVEIVSVRGKNLFNEDIANENYYYNASGVKTYDENYKYINQEIAFSSSYTISFSSKTGSITNIRLCEYNGTTFVKRTLINTNGTTITLDSNTNKVIVSVNSDDNCYFTNLMLEQGSTATTYLPYNTIEIEQRGKNYLINNGTTQTKNGVTFTKNGDGSITVNGTATANASITICSSLTLSSGTYMLSGNSGGSSTTRRLYCPDFPAYDDGSGKSFTLSSEKSSSCILLVFSGQTFSNVKIYPMIEKGSSATTYEPYQTPQTYQLPLGSNTLKGIGSVKDKLTIDYLGNVSLVKNIGEVTLNGSETYTNSGFSSHNYTYMMKTVINNMKSAINDNEVLPVLSNYFPNGFSYTSLGMSAIGTNGITIAQNHTLTICHQDYDKTQTDNFKTWLSTHNTKVQYPLATATTETLTPTSQIVLYEGTNIFNLVCEGTPSIEIDYITKVS